jgi:hypothetical protein
MCVACREEIVDRVIGEGRIAFEKRATYLRALEQNPHETAEFLADLRPDPGRAQANRALSDPKGVEAERQLVAANLGIPADEVI